MATTSSPTSVPEERELVITRVFDAPRERVWKMWTEPESIKLWWGPVGFTAPYVRIDLRVDGKYLYCMRGSDGKEYWSGGTFREIVPMERIVATDSFTDKDGNIVSATSYGLSAEYPLELMLTVTFEDEENGKTKLTIRHAGHPSGQDMEGARIGWTTSLDKFAEALAK
jgi:uncharacterized protein YndB with AHSA1/START domain